MKPLYWNTKRIKKEKAQYNIVIGERSNGKTYGVLDSEILLNYVQNKKQGALIRRFREDFAGKRGQQMFESLVNNKLVSKYTDGEWTDIYYYSSRWYLSKWDEELNKRIIDENPFCYAFSLASMEHDKSTSYPNVTTILFDEFLTRGAYLTDEFVLFMNVVSTIVRDRTDVTIWMCGNTINQYSPYFTEMGLNHIKNMKKGDLEVYQYGNSELKVAVEFSDSPNKKGKPSDVYFAFDNPRLKMITSGVWEVDLYPHCPVKYYPKDIAFTYFIIWDKEILQCEIVYLKNEAFTFIHRKTTPIKDEDKDIIYSTEYSPKPNWKRKITKATDDLEKRIASFYVKDKIFYQDNSVGEIMRNYLNWCVS